MTENTTSDLREKFIRSEATATYGIAITSSEYFYQHHFTYLERRNYLKSIPALEEPIEIKHHEVDEFRERRKTASLKMDERRKRLGPIDIKVADLIKEAREERIKDIFGEDK